MEDYGHILTEEEYYLLEEKFGEYLYGKLEDYSYHLICRNSYSAGCDYYAFTKWW